MILSIMIVPALQTLCTLTQAKIFISARYTERALLYGTLLLDLHEPTFNNPSFLCKAKTLYVENNLNEQTDLKAKSMLASRNGMEFFTQPTTTLSVTCDGQQHFLTSYQSVETSDLLAELRNLPKRTFVSLLNKEEVLRGRKVNFVHQGIAGKERKTTITVWSSSNTKSS